jgi:hypothetical protein
MIDENLPPLRARRWTPPPGTGARTSPFKSYRFMLRLIVIPTVAVAGVFIYGGLRDRFVLPECDSDRAKKTLSDILKQFKLEPARYEPIKTVSSTKNDVVCNAALPLPDGGTVAIDYRFYWQGNDADMKYSVVRKAPEDSTVTPPAR